MPPEHSPPIRFQGRSGAPGISRGVILVYDPEIVSTHPRQIGSEQVGRELKRLETAIRVSETEILQAIEKLTDELGEDHARIFEAHRYILLDDVLLKQARELIKECWSAETAYAQACEGIFRSFEHLGEAMAERSSDLRDVEKRVLGHLQGQRRPGFRDLQEQVIVVARDISPSDAATMNRDMVLGFITERGGDTSHAVILGRSLGIPVIVGAEDLMSQVSTGDRAILDGNTGIFILHPDDEAEAQFERLNEAYIKLEQESLIYKDFPAETRDGRTIELLANIELPLEVSGAMNQGAAGIGLYRTEYLFLTSNDWPDEEEQFQAYREVLERMAPDPVIIRTMDLGGEKVAQYLDFPTEDNPSLGWRGVRYALAHEKIFRVQLRAIYRASAFGNLRVMVPMISQVEEIRLTKELIASVQTELANEGYDVARDVQLGLMIETPSAVVVAHHLAREVDFFSIGTNDLIQYSLAIDRDNEFVQHMYDPFHPAILRQIKRTVKAARDGGIWVGLCGEIPEDPLFIILLIGLGLDEISVNSYRIPDIKRYIRSITHDQAKNLVKSAWSYATSPEIRRNVRRLAIKKFPELENSLNSFGRSQ